jgi:predicted permease
MHTLWQDLRYGTRLLRQNYGFTLIAVLSLALGIGANTALFSVVDAVLLKKLPVQEPDRLVFFRSLTVRDFSVGGYNGNTETDAATGLTSRTSFPYISFTRMREQESALSELFAFGGVGVNVNIDGQADVASAQAVSGNYFKGLGVGPMLGRLLTGDDDRAAASPATVISHRFWELRFRSDPAAIGKQVSVNNVSFTIVGVTPPEFSGAMQVGSSPDLSFPLAMEPQVSAGRSRQAGAGQWWLKLMGRLKPGATTEQARAGLEAIFQQSVVEHRITRQNLARSQGQTPLPSIEPKDYPRFVLDSGSQGEMDVRRRYASQLYLLLGVVGLVLLIACANVANLLLARAASRHKEIAVRLALGASRFRLIRQLLTENVLLAALGATLGIVFALWIKDGLLTVGSWGGGGMSALAPQLDLRVLGFTAGLALLTGILFGLAPALRATRVDLTPSLKESARSSSGVSRSVLSKALVVAQVAMSLVLLVGAGLFVRTLRNLQNVETGFDTQRLLLFSVSPNLIGYQGDRLADLYKRIFERLEAIPGVNAATFSRNALLSGSASGRGVVFADAEASARRRGENEEIRIHQVRENYLEAMETPLLAGRQLGAQDDVRAPRVAIVNQNFAQRFFPDESPLGKRFGFDPRRPAEIEIIGVAKDAKYESLRSEITPTVYLPWLQELGGVGAMTFEVRTANDPMSVVPAVRQAVREVDANLPLVGIRTQAEQISQSLRTERLFTRLLSFFGMLALVLAAIGLYGVMAYSVAQRVREIGIRMAIGAQTRDVLRLVIGQGMILALVGVGVGLLASFWLTRLMSGLLFGVSTTDPLTFAAIAVLLTLIALLACYLPARRATKVDPLVALRYE